VWFGQETIMSFLYINTTRYLATQLSYIEESVWHKSYIIHLILM
jgi:hypothetical protein